MTNNPSPIRFQDGITSLTADLGTLRDKAASVYYSEPVADDQQLLAMYRTSWLARKIVDIPAHDSFRRWRTWQASDDQVEAIEKEEKRLDLKAKMLRTETLARLYGGAALYFDLDDDPSKPAPAKISKGGIKFCTVLSHWHLVPGEPENDPLSPNFGQPKWYEVAGAREQGAGMIHPSRLVLRYGTERPDFGLFGFSNQGAWGDSVLYAMKSSIEQFDGTAANLASLIYESKIDVISVQGLMQIAGDPIQEAKLLARYALAARTKGNNGMLLLDADSESYEQKNATFTTLPDIMDRFGQNAAGGADIPMTRLFGRSPGGMNSTGDADLRNYYDAIASDQELRIGPSMGNLDEMLIQSALGSRPVEIHYIWSSLWQIDDTERAALGKVHVETVTGMQSTGLFADEVLTDTLVSLMVDSSVIPGLEASIIKHGAPVDVDAPVAPPEPKDKPVKPQLKVVGGTQISDATPATLYVQRKVLNGAALVRWAKSQGFTAILSADDMHVTIAYSRAPVDWMAAGNDYNKTLTIDAFGPRRVETLGRAAVLMFASHDLKWRHESFKDYGASWDHDGYQPHVTISYSGMPEGVEAYTGPIELGPELFSELDPNWTATLTDEAAGQPRAPKGTPNGGQWIKGGATGGSNPYAAAAASIATAKYDADKIQALTEKAPGDLTHYEKKMLAKYKKALEAEKAKTPAKEPAKKKASLTGEALAAYNKGDIDIGELEDTLGTLKSSGLISYAEADAALASASKPKLSAAEQIAQDYKDGKITATQAGDNYIIDYGAGAIDKAAMVAGVAAMQHEQKVAKLNKLEENAALALAASTEAYKGNYSKADKEYADQAYNKAVDALYLAKKDLAEGTPPANVSGLTAPPSAKKQEAAAPISAQTTQDKALASVATAQYPVEKIKGLMNKNPADLTQYEKKKLNAYKKALQTEASAAAFAGVSMGGGMSTTMSAVNPQSAVAKENLKKIAQQYGHNMNVETVEKLASGEWQPQAGKAYQKDVAKHAAEYLKTGVMPTISSSSSSHSGTKTLATLLQETPPPTSEKGVAQQSLAKIATPLSEAESSAAKQYTGSTYADINNGLRNETGKHHLVSSIDSAMAKTASTKDLVMVRGINNSGMTTWLNKTKTGSLKVGTQIKDLGYVSTTRQETTAQSFAGYNGYGFKIEVPKGSRILPLKSISSHAQEDEFLLPRGSTFQVKNIEGKVITLSLING